MTLVIVRFQVEGFHCWPAAPENRSYLRERHRHLFHVEARVEVTHDDREIEIHDLRDFCLMHFPSGELGSLSCENLATILMLEIRNAFPDRVIQVEVLEDGENGAFVQNF